jgi:multisubunit Na+/H+ antiporter MnhB subunit
MIALYILLSMMILGALVAIEVRSLISSVVAVGAVGLGLSLVFLLLKAPDVALTQLVVEIIAVIILIRATIRRRLPESPVSARPYGVLLGLGFAVLLVLVSLPALQEIPRLGQPTMRVARTYVESGLQDTGAANLVASVILDYRAYDTLGEATVLFTAVMGVMAVLRNRGLKDGEEG